MTTFVAPRAFVAQPVRTWRTALRRRRPVHRRAVPGVAPAPSQTDLAAYLWGLPR